MPEAKEIGITLKTAKDMRTQIAMLKQELADRGPNPLLADAFTKAQKLVTKCEERDAAEDEFQKTADKVPGARIRHSVAQLDRQAEIANLLAEIKKAVSRIKPN